MAIKSALEMVKGALKEAQKEFSHSRTAWMKFGRLRLVLLKNLQSAGIRWADAEKKWEKRNEELRKQHEQASKWLDHLQRQYDRLVVQSKPKQIKK